MVGLQVCRCKLKLAACWEGRHGSGCAGNKCGDFISCDGPCSRSPALLALCITLALLPAGAVVIGPWHRTP